MDITERMRLEAAPPALVLPAEHRHRYEFIAVLCADRRVLELWCGDGQGSAILAERAASVLGIDADAASIDGAQASLGRERENLEFEIADPLAFLETVPEGRFDVVVCFDVGLAPAERSRLLELAPGRPSLALALRNRHGGAPADGAGARAAVTLEQARELVAPLGGAEIVPQFLAEGSLISPAGASGEEVRLVSDERTEPEYADHFIVLSGFDPQELSGAHDGRLQLSASPAPNRLVRHLGEELRTLRAENARLGRRYLGKGGSAAAAALQRLERHDAEVAALRDRLREAEQRAAELGATLVELTAAEQPPLDGPAAPRSGPAVRAAVIEALPALPIEPDPGEDPNSWEMRHRRADQALIPWIEQTVPLAGKTVLEYGCGNAAVSCALATHAKRVIGVDIDSGWIELGREAVRERGLKNVELELHPPESIRDAVAARRGQVDVFLLYAVLEHLTIPERLAVLRLAREVVKPDGAIVVCEAPNRLIYFDHHTSQMPFFHLLDDELALEYRARSARPDFKDTLEKAIQGGPEYARETLWRLGRGISFHEFELVFGENLGRHVLASNFDPLLFGERPIHPDEVILWRYLARWRPDLAPVWSRYWLDLILSPQPVDKRPPWLRPWVADTVASKEVGFTAWENLRMKSPESTLWVTLPQPTSRLVVGSVTQDGRWLVLQARPEGAPESLTAGHTAPARVTAFSSFVLPEPSSRIGLQASDECDLVFVGYEE